MAFENKELKPEIKLLPLKRSLGGQRVVWWDGRLCFIINIFVLLNFFSHTTYYFDKQNIIFEYSFFGFSLWLPCAGSFPSWDSCPRAASKSPRILFPFELSPLSPYFSLLCLVSEFSPFFLSFFFSSGLFFLSKELSAILRFTIIFKGSLKFVKLVNVPRRPRRFFFLTSLLEYNCFTVFCWFLLYNKVHQLYVYIYPHTPSLLRLPPTLPIPPL